MDADQRGRRPRERLPRVGLRDRPKHHSIGAVRARRSGRSARAFRRTPHWM